jgi:hypothetical protein
MKRDEIIAANPLERFLISLLDVRRLISDS